MIHSQCPHLVQQICWWNVGTLPNAQPFHCLDHPTHHPTNFVLLLTLQMSFLSQQFSWMNNVSQTVPTYGPANLLVKCWHSSLCPTFPLLGSPKSPSNKLYFIVITANEVPLPTVVLNYQCFADSSHIWSSRFAGEMLALFPMPNLPIAWNTEITIQQTLF